MYKLFAIILAGVVGAGVWRRKELRNDADRAAKSLVNAAKTTRSRLPGVADGDGMAENEPSETDGAAGERAAEGTSDDDPAVPADAATSPA